MGAEIKSIHGGHVTGQPDEDVVNILEALLERAKSGDLIGIAYATTNTNGDQATGWCGVAGTRHPVGTAITMLQHRYHAALMEK